MNTNDTAIFAKIMLGMADNFRDTLSKEGIEMRFEMLKDYTVEQVTKAAKQIMATRKYTKMPTIAEFLEAINGPGIPIEDQAIIAADAIIAHLKLLGATRYPDFGDDKIAKSLMSERWPYRAWASSVLESELVWWKKEFIESYRAYKARDENDGYITGNKQLKLLAGGIGKKI